MNVPNRILNLLFLFVLVSCTQEDTLLSLLDEMNQDLASENTILNAQEVYDQLLIPGSLRMPGVPSTPTGGISLDISGSTRTALLTEGFDIAFISDGTPVGAYIRIKSLSGTFSNGYFDVALQANSTGKQEHTVNRKFVWASAAQASGYAVNLDFGQQIPPGEFCYEIRVYDAQGQVSEAKEACVTVANWGGKKGMAGTWTMVREDKIIAGQTYAFELGAQGCTPNQFPCQDGTTLQGTDCRLSEFAEVVFSEDGSYRVHFKGIRTSTDEADSYESCRLLNRSVAYDEESEGKWAYVDEESRLTIVEYHYKRREGGVTKEEYTAEPGGARLVIDGNIVLTERFFVVTDTRDDYGGDLDGAIRKYYFERL